MFSGISIAQRQISPLHDHYIVCGLGDTGRTAVEALQAAGAPYLVIEAQEDVVRKLCERRGGAYCDMSYIIGDATDEATLREADVEHARGLIAALPSEKNNLVITVIVRQQNPTLRIVSRYTDVSYAKRMLKAGADSTVSPEHIGGLRVASEVLRPNVVSFLDLMLQEKSRRLRIEDIYIPESSPWAGMTLGKVKLAARYGLLPVAVKNSGEPEAPKFWSNPPDHLLLRAGAVIVVMGNLNEIGRARQEAVGKAELLPQAG